MSADEDAIAYHDRIAAGWDARYRSGAFRRRAQFFRTVILPRLNASGRWLDAGCGSGYFSRMLGGCGVQVLGLDASPAMIEAARELAAHEGVDAMAQFQRIDTVHRMPCADAAFDGVLALSLVEYLDDPVAGIDEMLRVLRPGGHLVFSIPNRRSLLRMVQKLARRLPGAPAGSAFVDHSTVETTPAELRELLARRGMQDIELQSFDPFLPRFLHAVLPASLIYVLARKPGRAPRAIPGQAS